MTTARLILFDDDLSDLSPLNDLRAVFELRSGALTSAQRIVDQLQQPLDALFVSERLAELVAERFDLPVNHLPPGETYFLVNGGLTASPPAPPSSINHRIVDDTGYCLAAHLDAHHAQRFLEAGQATLDDLPAETRTDLLLLRRPWHLLDAARRNLIDDLDHSPRLPRQPLSASPVIHRIGDQPVRLGDAVRLDPPLVLDTTTGPITIDHHAHLGSFAVIQGPAYIGPGSCVAPHALIRPFTIVGPVCKVAGEISNCVFQGFANKAHLGFLGDSFVGQWVNLGAHTNTSNLKNTYGQIRFQGPHDTQPVDTGCTFLGSIIGDHVKTAIGTRLTSGSCLGTGAMIALSGFAPKTVACFSFLTDRGPQRYQWDKFQQVAQRVMQRRDHPLTDAQRRCMKALHDASMNRP